MCYRPLQTLIKIYDVRKHLLANVDAGQCSLAVFMYKLTDALSSLIRAYDKTEFKLRNIPDVLRNVPCVLRNVISVLRNVPIVLHIQS